MAYHHIIFKEKFVEKEGIARMKIDLYSESKKGYDSP